MEATSKVVFDMSNFLGTKWHHDVEQSWADFIYYMASGWEFAEDEAKSARESEVSSATQGFYSVVKGVKIVGDSLEIYIDYYHFDLNKALTGLCSILEKKAIGGPIPHYVITWLGPRSGKRRYCSRRSYSPSS